MKEQRWTLTQDRSYTFAAHIKVLGCPEDEFALIKGIAHYVGHTIPITSEAILAKRDELYARLSKAAGIIATLKQCGWVVNDAYGEWTSGLRLDANANAYLCLMRSGTGAEILSDLTKAGAALIRDETVVIEVLSPTYDGWEVQVTGKALLVHLDVDSILSSMVVQNSDGKVIQLRPK